MKKTIEDKKILILDDDGTEGNLFSNCHFGSNKIKIKNISVVKTLSEFLEEVRYYDIRFVDFGELGYDGCQRFRADGVRIIAKFLEENPSIEIWFVLTMPWNYYESFTVIWNLPNAHHIQLDGHRDNWSVICG
jgi:mRNA-degrading endonuclease RelE of RelBE toxin-antitoxin system